MKSTDKAKLLNSVSDEEVLVQLVCGRKPPKVTVEEMLYEVCSSEHASCSDACPVFRLNGSKVPNAKKADEGCDCFKNGKTMAEFIYKTCLKLAGVKGGAI